MNCTYSGQFTSRSYMSSTIWITQEIVLALLLSKIMESVAAAQLWMNLTNHQSTAFTTECAFCAIMCALRAFHVCMLNPGSRTLHWFAHQFTISNPLAIYAHRWDCLPRIAKSESCIATIRTIPVLTFMLQFQTYRTDRLSLLYPWEANVTNPSIILTCCWNRTWIDLYHTEKLWLLTCATQSYLEGC